MVSLQCKAPSQRNLWHMNYDYYWTMGDAYLQSLRPFCSGIWSNFAPKDVRAFVEVKFGGGRAAAESVIYTLMRGRGHPVQYDHRRRQSH
ncbi:hypothetical protein MCOR02_004342 [Pyricularia oryzae]|uniref:Uncharacterized protein n=1 Tax=Pyricularia oryzae TaxID=318829 RepID=A0A4P7MW41_PYROR|nr:hypothetical protein MCOR02_004342 [Pyricularia oryzae]QBZ54288.1 hypothetical protein PoMZ_09984 [Pyricularia oryzae]